MILDQVAPHPILLAPMVGLTHLVVRRALQEQLPPGVKALWPTEMLSSRRIPCQRKGASLEIRMDDFGEGLCPQLLGNQEHFIRDSIAKLRDWGAVAIDINMGCPVRRALQHNYGVALMGDPDYAAEITAIAVKHARELPVSVKIRAAPPPGKEDSGKTDPEFLKTFSLKLEQAGASWVTLHPRTAAQKRKGDADWSQIKSLKSWLKIPVIGNGDIQTLGDAERMLAETGCDRVMIGRALMAKPWLMSQREPRDAYHAGELYGRFLSRVLELSREHYPESIGVRKFKYLLRFGHVYLEFGHTLTALISNAETYDELESRLKDFFGQNYERPQKMHERTALRY